MMHPVSKKMLVLLLGISLAHAMQENLISDKEVVGWKLVYKHQYFSPNKWNPQTFKITMDRYNNFQANAFTYTNSSGNPETVPFLNWATLKRALKKPSEADVEFVQSKIQSYPAVAGRRPAVFTERNGLVFHNFLKGKLKTGARVLIMAHGHHDTHMGKMGTIKAKLVKVDGVNQYNVKVDGRGSDNASFVKFSAKELKAVKAIYFTYDAEDDRHRNSPWGFIYGAGNGGQNTGMRRRMSVMDELLLASPKEKKR